MSSFSVLREHLFVYRKLPESVKIGSFRLIFLILLTGTYVRIIMSLKERTLHYMNEIVELARNLSDENKRILIDYLIFLNRTEEWQSLLASFRLIAVPRDGIFRPGVDHRLCTCSQSDQISQHENNAR